MGKTKPFWEVKPLTQMTASEWEALCDGCGKCCLHKLEDEDTGEVRYTAVACRLLDLKTIRCTNYENRKALVPDCLRLTADNIKTYQWLPETCAYKLLALGQPLPNWHPLVSGTQESVIKAGVSVKGKIISERTAGDIADYVLADGEF